jgi:hypothetical protein
MPRAGCTTSTTIKIMQQIWPVKSAWGAVAGLLPFRFPRPLTEPGVRLSPHRALHGDCRCAGAKVQGDGMWLLRHR